MPSDKDLKQSIGAAERSIREQEQLSKSLKSKAGSGSGRQRLVFLAVGALLFSGAAFAMYQEGRDQIVEDMKTTVLDMIMTADAEVIVYYEALGELPVELPDFSLLSFVSYEKVDNENFVLTSTFDDYNTPISRNINSTITDQEVQQILQLQ